jgi:hypothetical protein
LLFGAAVSAVVCLFVSASFLQSPTQNPPKSILVIGALLVVLLLLLFGWLPPLLLLT